jgi:hypothetical protein
MQLGEGLQVRLGLPPDDPERLIERVVHACRLRRLEERQ